MPLGLVLLQHKAYLRPQRAVDPPQPLCQILVYGRLADAELLRGGADSAFIFDDIRGQLAGPFLYTGMHSHHSPADAAPLRERAPHLSCSTI